VSPAQIHPAPLQTLLTRPDGPARPAMHTLPPGPTTTPVATPAPPSGALLGRPPGGGLGAGLMLLLLLLIDGRQPSFEAC
jgi:hypothetical protein